MLQVLGLLGSRVVLFCLLHLGVSWLKPNNIRKKGTLIIRGLLGNLDYTVMLRHVIKPDLTLFYVSRPFIAVVFSIISMVTTIVIVPSDQRAFLF